MKQITLILVALLYIATLFAQERGFIITPLKDKCLALVIGNSTYTYGDNLGEQPINDANDMKNKLKKLGFEVVIITNATKRQMDEEINAFGKKLPTFRVGLIFYAGHGIQVNNQNYLVPIDALIESKSDVAYACVPAGRMLGKMNDAKNDLNIVILDACRNNPFERKWTGRDIGEAGNGLAEMDAPKGTLISYATSPGKTAINDNGRNGLYTSKLLKYIDTPGLILENVFKKVRTEVYNTSDNKQLTWEKISVMGDFYFAGKGSNNNDSDDNGNWSKEVKYGNLKITTKIAGTLYFGNESGLEFSANGLRTQNRIKTGTYNYRFVGSETITGSITVYENQTAEIALKVKKFNDQFTDSRDGKTYKIVEIGSQVWMAENLAYKAKGGYWAYDNSERNVAKYGYLYNWETARNVCPSGWKLPSDDDWKKLEKNLEMSESDANKTGYRGTISKQLKASLGWYNRGNGNNSSGFNALPGGFWDSHGFFFFGSEGGYWWCSTPNGSEGAWKRMLHWDDDAVFRYESNRLDGYSVRCIQDN